MLSRCENAARIPLALRFSFDTWTVDADRRLLLHGGSPVPLSPKAFDLLKLLAEHHDRAFSKAELHQHLWPDTFVSDGSLTILVAEIRQVLKDDADEPKYIRTLRRFGYGFCATVRRDAPQTPAELCNTWVIWGNKSIAVGEGETILGRSLDYSEADLQRIMSPAHFVEVRKTHGGPAPSEAARAIGESKRLLDRDREAWRSRRSHLERAEAQLTALAQSL